MVEDRDEMDRAVDAFLAKLSEYAIPYGLRAGRALIYFLSTWLLAAISPLPLDHAFLMGLAIGLLSLTRIGGYMVSFSIGILILSIFIPQEAIDALLREIRPAADLTSP